jgi:4-hydroxy-2-oxoheptanedioate aldolase
MHDKNLNKLLQGNQRIYGTAIISSSPVWSSALSPAALDFVFLDTEHIPLDRKTLSWMCQTYNALGLVPIVRIPKPDPFEACMVLDGGATGIIAPYIESEEQVRVLVGATKLRPLKGKRLERILNDQEIMENELQLYLEKHNADNIFWINIESVPAINRLDQILAVPGLDGVIIGPHDLSCSMGIPEQYSNQNFENTVHDIIQKVRATNLGVGIHFSGDPELQIKWAHAGINIILHSSDISLFSQALHKDISHIRAALGEKTEDADRERGVIV